MSSDVETMRVGFRWRPPAALRRLSAHWSRRTCSHTLSFSSFSSCFHAAESQGFSAEHPLPLAARSVMIFLASARKRAPSFLTWVHAPGLVERHECAEGGAWPTDPCLVGVVGVHEREQESSVSATTQVLPVLQTNIDRAASLARNLLGNSGFACGNLEEV